jgi:hypothetical protein
MTNRLLGPVAAAMLIVCCGSAQPASAAANDQAGHPHGPADLLRAEYPGVRFNKDGDRVISIYGKPMTPGATPQQAAADFLAEHGGAFGVPELDLRVSWSSDVGSGNSTVFAYTQYIGGLPVDMGLARVLVLNGNPNHVIYAAGQLARVPEAGFARRQFTGKEAVELVRAIPAYSDMPAWGKPELVVYDGRADGLKMDAVQAWKFRADANVGLAERQGMTFFVDAATGALVFARNEILNTDVNGRVRGNATPGNKPDANGNSPVQTGIELIRVAIQGGNSVYTDADGGYTIPYGGGGQVNVSTSLDFGKWVDVNNLAGSVLSLNQNVTPPGPADFLFNPSPSELTTSQVNAFIHQTKIHNYFKDRAPGFTALDVSFPANVNIASTCNAYYDGVSTNFFKSGGGCVNSAYSTVVAHEYGHHIVNRLGLAQDAFGEGYGDTCSVMLYDTSIIAEDFYGPGSPIRDVYLAHKQYPCGGEIHDCGQVLAGFWYDAKEQFKTTYGSQLGLELSRQLEVDWSLITVGGVNGQSASPTTAIEVLTANDVDGDLDNGTPDWYDICNALGKHGIACPELILIAFAYPDGLPAELTPNAPATIRVNVVPVNGLPQPGSGEIHYRLHGQSFISAPMDEPQANQYVATIPGFDCPDAVEYYFSAKAEGGLNVVDPPEAPAEFFSVVVGRLDTQVALTVGFNAGLPGDWQATGLWHVGSACSPGDSCDGGTFAYYGKDATCKFNTPGQRTTGTLSTVLTLPSVSPAGTLKLAYCSNLLTENKPGLDTAKVFIDGVKVDQAQESANWQPRSVDITAYAGQTVDLAFTFDSLDAYYNNFRGWQVDGIQLVVTDAVCDAGCYPDFTGDGTLDLFDFLAFVNAFNAHDPSADCIPDGTLDLFDFLCFVNAFNAGC